MDLCFTNIVTPTVYDLAYAVAEKEEGFSAVPYYCSEGYPTIGHGHRIGPKNYPLEGYEFTVNREVASAFLKQRLTEKANKIYSHAFFQDANAARRAIFLSMAFQMGVHGLLKFKNMIAAAKIGDWETAANEALDSKWARNDSPSRAKRHAEVLRVGLLEEV